MSEIMDALQQAHAKLAEVTRERDAARKQLTEVVALSLQSFGERDEAREKLVAAESLLRKTDALVAELREELDYEESRANGFEGRWRGVCNALSMAPGLPTQAIYAAIAGAVATREKLAAGERATAHLVAACAAYKEDLAAAQEWIEEERKK